MHTESIKRGELLLQEIDRDIKMYMVEMQKDRILLDDADVELQYLQDEIVTWQERKKKELEEEKRR